VQAREQRNDKRARILDAAVKVFAERGYFSSTVAEIARAAGVADGTIYLYFKSKDDLLLRLFDEKMTQLLAEAKAALAEERDAPSRLKRFIQLHFSLVEKNPDLASVLVVELRQSAQFLKSADRQKLGAAYLDLIAQVVREGQEKGELAAYVGSIMVIVFMLVTYRLFGVFANIAVAINVAMIFGLLSLLNATLTLPGIAGIVLTVGIAVDSNVLIYERIREELRGGRNAISAIDAGFRRALATILDSNITTFIAAAVLFYIGTGPVRGFAVTLGIGIITTVFTAFTLTSLIVAGWVRWKRPKTVPI